MRPELVPAGAAPLGSVETDRLLLRRFEPSDLGGLAEVFAKREEWQFPYGHAFTRSETSRFHHPSGLDSRGSWLKDGLARHRLSASRP